VLKPRELPAVERPQGLMQGGPAVPDPPAVARRQRIPRPPAASATDRPNEGATRGGQGDSTAIAVLLGENLSGSRFRCGAGYRA